MAQPTGKRLTMRLYAGADDLHSHRVRIVLAEKGICADIIEVSPTKLPECLLELNPYGSIPMIIDRDLVLYQTNVITEYLDERFPHPPLLPVYPVARAISRQTIHRIERDWYPLLQQIENSLHDTTSKNSESARIAQKELEDSLVSLAPLFTGKCHKPFFLSDDFTLVDCCIAPLLWRLHRLDIKLTPAIKEYETRLFQRASFKATLNEVESGVKI